MFVDGRVPMDLGVAESVEVAESLWTLWWPSLFGPRGALFRPRRGRVFGPRDGSLYGPKGGRASVDLGRAFVHPGIAGSISVDLGVAEPLSTKG